MKRPLTGALGALPYPAIAGALIGAPPLRLGECAREAAKAGLDVLHLDIMDGYLTEQISFGAAAVRDLASEVDLLLDVHLLTRQPDRQIDAFIDAGANILSFQLEASRDPSALLRRIRGAGIAGGIGIGPETPLSEVSVLAEELDILIVMTVVPGTSLLVEGCFEKVEQARALCDHCARPPRLAVDGGVTLANVHDFVSCGADWLVSASALFRDIRGTAAACADMRALAVD